MHDIKFGETLVAHLRLYAAVTMVVLPLSFSARAQPKDSGFVVVDARTYRHCHNAPTRTYCHKKDALPMNWPPFSDRSHRKMPKQRMPCKQHSGNCADQSIPDQADYSKVPA